MSDSNRKPTEIDTKIDHLDNNTEHIDLPGSINANLNDALRSTFSEEKDDKIIDDEGVTNEKKDDKIIDDEGVTNEKKDDKIIDDEGATIEEKDDKIIDDEGATNEKKDDKIIDDEGATNEEKDDKIIDDEGATNEEKDDKRINDKVVTNEESENLTPNVGEGKDDEKAFPTKEKEASITDENKYSLPEDLGKEKGHEAEMSSPLNVENDASSKEIETVVISSPEELFERKTIPKVVEPPLWMQEKEKYLNASVDERRDRRKRKCTEYHEIETWPEYCNKYLQNGEEEALAEFPEISNKVSIWKGDITCLLIDAIVNAANEKLLGGGGVDGAIHSAAGPLLKEECRKFGGCSAGESVITAAYKLPAKYVIHTVGPRGEFPDKLKNCYMSSLQLLIDENQRTIAFPCISTGIFGYPNDKAAEVVVKNVREWLEINHEKVDRVIFCLFLEKDVYLYEKKLLEYFPMKNIHIDSADIEDDQKEVNNGLHSLNSSTDENASINIMYPLSLIFGIIRNSIYFIINWFKSLF